MQPTKYPISNPLNGQNNLNGQNGALRNITARVINSQNVHVKLKIYIYIFVGVVLESTWPLLSS